MKKILSFLIVPILYALIGCATAPAAKLQKQEIIDLPGMSKEKIFNKTNQWIASTFGSANAVIQYKDLKEGSFVCNIITTTSAFATSMSFHTTMTIDIKENKSRLSFAAHDLSKSGTPYQTIYESEAEYAIKSFEPIKSSYKNYMLNKSKKADDNW